MFVIGGASMEAKSFKIQFGIESGPIIIRSVGPIDFIVWIWPNAFFLMIDLFTSRAFNENRLENFNSKWLNFKDEKLCSGMIHLKTI